jgi:hypothetical protein
MLVKFRSTTAVAAPAIIVDMTKSELTPLLPRHRDDAGNARAIVALGFPTVEPVLTSLFQWLDSNGSPVELIVRPFFASLGASALHLAREALDAPIRPALKCTLLRNVLPEWPIATVAMLEPQLRRLIMETDFHGCDVWALRLMIDKSIPTDEDVERWKQFKIARLRELLCALES